MIRLNFTLVFLSSYYVPGLFISSGDVMRLQKSVAGKNPLKLQNSFSHRLSKLVTTLIPLIN